MNDDPLLARLSAAEPSLTLAQDVAQELWESNPSSQLLKLAARLSDEPAWQQRACAVFLLGMLAVHDDGALASLRATALREEDSNAQQAVGVAFDYYCQKSSAEAARAAIEEWLATDCGVAHRAAEAARRHMIRAGWR